MHDKTPATKAYQESKRTTRRLRERQKITWKKCIKEEAGIKIEELEERGQNRQTEMEAFHDSAMLQQR